MKKLLVIFGLIGGVVCDAMMPTPFFTTLAHAAPFNCAEYKTRISNQSAKDAAKDIPSWAQGAKPCKKPVSESGNDFAKRLMAAQYPGKAYDTGPSSEYSMIKKGNYIPNGTNFIKPCACAFYRRLQYQTLGILTNSSFFIF